MLLAFIDESGRPHPNDKATRPVLVSVCIQAPDMKAIDTDMFRIKKQILDKDQFDFEAKGTALITPGHFKNTPRKREFVDAFFNLVDKWNVRVFADVMHRPLNPPPTDVTFLPAQFRSQLVRIDRYLELNYPDKIAIALLDGNGQQDNKIALRYNNWMYRTHSGRSLSRIADSPYSVDSKITPGIQIADMAASVIRQYYEKELFSGTPTNSEYLASIARYYGILKSKTVDLPSTAGSTMARLQAARRVCPLCRERNDLTATRGGARASPACGRLPVTPHGSHV